MSSSSATGQSRTRGIFSRSSASTTSWRSRTRPTPSMSTPTSSADGPAPTIRLRGAMRASTTCLATVKTAFFRRSPMQKWISSTSAAPTIQPEPLPPESSSQPLSTMQLKQGDHHLRCKLCRVHLRGGSSEVDLRDRGSKEMRHRDQQSFKVLRLYRRPSRLVDRAEGVDGRG